MHERINVPQVEDEGKNSTIYLVPYKNESPSNEIIQQIIPIFKDAFGGYPWFEKYKCTNCDQYFQSIPHATEDCNKPNIQEAFSDEEITEMVLELKSKKNSALFLLFKDHQVAGFCWGYSQTVNYAIKKFGDNSLTVRQQIDLTTGNATEVFALSEVGINPILRGQGLGKKLVQNVLSHANDFNQHTVVWTRSDTVLSPICLKNSFKQLFGPELTIVNGQTALTGNIISGVDRKTPERVYFIK